jgi:hypothetical protein
MVKEACRLESSFREHTVSLTIIPYSDAIILTVGTKGLLGSIYECSCPNLAVSALQHRQILGDRDDLAGNIFAQRLGENVLRRSKLKRIVLVNSLPKDLLMDADVRTGVEQWVLGSLT